jgi:hypothetical protein
MVLEGGYNLDSLSSSVSACIKVLLGDRNCIHSKLTSLPYDTTVKLVLEVHISLALVIGMIAYIQ